MNTDKTLQKIEDFFKKSFVKDIYKGAILKVGPDSYQIFGLYRIEATEDKKYKVVIHKREPNKIFYSLKNAVAWCILDKKNKIVEEKRLEQLDLKLESVNAAIVMHKKLLEITKSEDSKYIYLAKLSQEESFRNSLIKELGKYIDTTDVLQSFQKQKITKS